MNGKLSDKSMGLFIAGLSLIAVSLGSLYWIRFVRYGDILFFGAILISSYYISKSLVFWRRGAKLQGAVEAVGLLSLFLLLLLFGVQAPQLPAKKLIFAAGVLLVFPALKEYTHF